MQLLAFDELLVIWSIIMYNPASQVLLSYSMFYFLVDVSNIRLILKVIAAVSCIEGFIVLMQKCYTLMKT